MNHEAMSAISVFRVTLVIYHLQAETGWYYGLLKW